MLKNSSGMIVATPFAGFSIKSFSSILVRNFQPEGSFLNWLAPGGKEFLVGVLRFETQLEPLHDPCIAFSIVKQQHFGALVPTQPALPRDGDGLVGRGFSHASRVIAHIQLGDPNGRNAVEVPL